MRVPQILIAAFLISMLFYGIASATDVNVIVAITHGTVPAAGVEVQVYHFHSGTPFIWGYTNSTGQITFTIAGNAQYTVNVTDFSTDPYTEASQDIQPDSALPYSTINFDLGESHTSSGAPVAIQVTALDSKTNDPVPNATITEHWNASSAATATGITNEFGTVTFQNVTHGATVGAVFFYGSSSYYVQTSSSQLTITEQAMPQTFYVTLHMQQEYVIGQEKPKPLCSMVILFPAAILCLLLVVGQKRFAPKV